jgi:fucose permease
MDSSQAIRTVATIAGAVVFGMVIVLLGCVRPQLAARLNLSERRLRGLWAWLNLVLVPMAFLGGLLGDIWDVRWVLLLGCLVMALGLFSLAAASSRAVVRLAFLATGMGGGFLVASTLVLMPLAFFGPHEASASLNMGNVFFALGALIAPALTDVLLRSVGLSRALTMAGVLCLTPALLILFVPPIERVLETAPTTWEVLLDPMLWLAGLVFFLYAPLEGTLHTWGSAYLQNMGHSERSAAVLISGFWSCFLLGRLLVAYLQHWRFLSASWDTWILIFLAGGATVILANLVGTAKRGGATRGVLLLGFCLGPIFPTLIGRLFSAPEYTSAHGTVFGTVFAIGSAGSLLFAPIITARFHRKSAQSALRIPLFLGALLTMAALFFGLAIDAKG